MLEKEVSENRDPRLREHPETIGKYKIRGVLSSSPGKVVYEGFDVVADREVALKVITLPRDAREEDREHEEKWFLRQARLMAGLHHPNIVTLYEAFQEKAHRVLAMQLVKGCSFSRAWEEKAFNRRRAVEILRDIALAVHYAHEQGVIHRNLAPDNILLDGEHAPFVSDFGLAQGISPEKRITLTGKGITVGTPEHMSPEQACAAQNLDARADIYALGAILYRLLSGRPPFTGKTPVQTMMKIVEETLVAPSTHAREAKLPSVPPLLEYACSKALSKDRKDRQASGRQFAEDLEAWLRKVEV
jgi:serine/threonine protein kinase